MFSYTSFDCFFFCCSCDPRYLHVLTHSFPTRRSSVLRVVDRAGIPLAFYSFREDVWDAMDYELGAAKVDPRYWDDPDVVKRGTTPQFTTSRSEEHTSELQSLMRISYAVFCLKKKNNQ